MDCANPRARTARAKSSRARASIARNRGVVNLLVAVRRMNGTSEELARARMDCANRDVENLARGDYTVRAVTSHTRWGMYRVTTLNEARGTADTTF
jgi:hypothetical protein